MFFASYATFTHSGSFFGPQDKELPDNILTPYPVVFPPYPLNAAPLNEQSNALGLKAYYNDANNSCLPPQGKGSEPRFIPALAALVAYAVQEGVSLALNEIDDGLKSNLKKYFAAYTTHDEALPFFTDEPGAVFVPDFDTPALKCIRIVRVEKNATKNPYLDATFQVVGVQGSGFVFTPLRVFVSKLVADPRDDLPGWFGTGYDKIRGATVPRKQQIKIQFSANASSTWIDHGTGKSGTIFSSTLFTLPLDPPGVAGGCKLNYAVQPTDGKEKGYFFVDVTTKHRIGFLYYFKGLSNDNSNNSNDNSNNSVSVSDLGSTPAPGKLCPVVVDLTNGNLLSEPMTNDAEPSPSLPLPPISSDLMDTVLGHFTYTATATAEDFYVPISMFSFSVAEDGNPAKVEVDLEQLLAGQKAGLSSDASNEVKSLLSSSSSASTAAAQ